MSTLRDLIPLYQRMSELTAPECKSSCRLPHSCCHEEYCGLTIDHAKSVWGIDLQRTEHPKLPLMRDGTLGTCSFGPLNFRGRMWAIPVVPQSKITVVAEDSEPGWIPIFLEPRVKSLTATVLGINTNSIDMVDTKEFFRVGAARVPPMIARTDKTPISQQSRSSYLFATLIGGDVRVGDVVLSPLPTSFKVGSVFIGMIDLDVSVGTPLLLPSLFRIGLLPFPHSGSISPSSVLNMTIGSAIPKVSVWSFERLLAFLTENGLHPGQSTSLSIQFQPEGPDGCTAAPHLRPICTMHTCDVNSMGFKVRPAPDPEWTKEYFKLRGQIEDLELEVLDLTDRT